MLDISKQFLQNTILAGNFTYKFRKNIFSKREGKNTAMMYNTTGKQTLRYLTILILVIFSVSVLTFYWIIATSPLTINIGNLPEEEYHPIFNKFASELSKLSKLHVESKLKSDSKHENTSYHSVTVINSLSSTMTSKLSSESKYGDYKNSNELQSSSYSSLAKNKFEETEQEIEMRVNRATNICKKYHLGKYKWANGSNDLNEKEPPTPLYSYFFWNRERHLAWCPVYKAGSTSWLYNMMILAGYSEAELDNPPKQFSTMAREVYGNSEPDLENLEQSLKLLIVRHPFERLVSAYRDKLSNSTIGHEHGSLHFYKKYGQKIVKAYRKKGNKSKTTITQIEPTWVEFVDYLTSTNLIHYSDDHWLPAYYSCTPCLVDYDIIAKLETYSRDQAYIIYKAGLEGLLKPRWSHKTSKVNEKINSISHKYFSQLTKSQIEKLYKKYWFDFELFGYDYKEYLKYGKD